MGSGEENQVALTQRGDIRFLENKIYNTTQVWKQLVNALPGFGSGGNNGHLYTRMRCQQPQKFHSRVTRSTHYANTKHSLKPL
jgi:hypothetical protein